MRTVCDCVCDRVIGAHAHVYAFVRASAHALCERLCESFIARVCCVVLYCVCVCVLTRATVAEAILIFPSYHRRRLKSITRNGRNLLIRLVISFVVLRMYGDSGRFSSMWKVFGGRGGCGSRTSRFVIYRLDAVDIKMKQQPTLCIIQIQQI